jgi:hypothetical protein
MAGPIRAAPVFVPGTTKTRGGAGPFLPQKGPSFDIILSSTSEVQRSSHALFAQHQRSAEFSSTNLFTASDSLNFTKQHASVRRD